MSHSAHDGYLDGLAGRDPQAQSRDYETGWLHGTADRDAGKAPPTERPLPQPGDVVTIPKGTPIHSMQRGAIVAQRTYQVTVHHAYPPMTAHVDWSGNFHRPRPAKVIWPGAGGYWHEASLDDVCGGDVASG